MKDKCLANRYLKADQMVQLTESLLVTPRRYQMGDQKEQPKEYAWVLRQDLSWVHQMLVTMVHVKVDQMAQPKEYLWVQW